MTLVLSIIVAALVLLVALLLYRMSVQRAVIKNLAKHYSPGVSYDYMRDTYKICGTEFSAAIFRMWESPDPTILYRFQRQGEIVLVERVGVYTPPAERSVLDEEFIEG